MLTSSITALRGRATKADRDTWGLVRTLAKVGLITAILGLAWVYLVRALLSDS